MSNNESESENNRIYWNSFLYNINITKNKLLEEINKFYDAYEKNSNFAFGKTSKEQLENELLDFCQEISKIISKSNLDLNSEKINFFCSIKHFFTVYDIEDGLTHPVEVFIEEKLKYIPLINISEWIKSFFETNYINNPVFAGNILRVTSRLDEEGFYDLIVHMSIEALKSSNIELRDNAVRALEGISDIESLKILKAQSKIEQSDWLRDYILKIIDQIIDGL